MAELKPCATVALAIALSLAFGAAAPPREINITTDSAPEWLPSEEMATLVKKTARDYWAMKDAGSAADAYAFLEDQNKGDQPYPTFASRVVGFNAKAGKVIERRILKITWTKDPAQAPAPGIYAALDVMARFALVDRYCGYLVLYQAPSGGPFKVMREEENIMANASYDSIVRTKSRADADGLWTQLSANCPNYPGFSAQP